MKKTQEPRIMWKAWISSSKIEPYIVVRETEHFVTYHREGWDGGIRERKEAKESRYERWFSTWEEAKDWLMARAMRKISDIESEHARAMERLSRVESLTKPEDKP